MDLTTYIVQTDSIFLGKPLSHSRFLLTCPPINPFFQESYGSHIMVVFPPSMSRVFCAFFMGGACPMYAPTHGFVSYSASLVLSSDMGWNITKRGVKVLHCIDEVEKGEHCSWVSEEEWDVIDCIVDVSFKDGSFMYILGTFWEIVFDCFFYVWAEGAEWGCMLFDVI